MSNSSRPAAVAVGLCLAVCATAQPTLVIPEHLRGNTIPPNEHPHSVVINTFLGRQPDYSAGFQPTGFSRADYLPVIDSIARGMRTYQQPNGTIRDPVIGREHQYSTPAYAHAVAVLFRSGFVAAADTALLNSGIRAMDAAVASMQSGNSVPDGHGDFYTVLLMLAFENFKGVVTSAEEDAWRTLLGNIPTSKYNNAAPNWTGINMAGEFLRFREGLTTSAWVQQRMGFQVSRLGAGGMYQDVYGSIETPQNINNTDGNSVAYDQVARGILGIIATGGYDGVQAEELRLRLWRGAWTGLLYQSSHGEVPTGMRSSHHLWNEAYAAVNYEMWAAQYALAGRPEIAGAFKRAAHLSLGVTKQWLRPSGLGFITKARYPATARWGYMAYSGLMQYNGWTASALALAWQVADTAIAEHPAPADIGGYVMPVIPGFKKVFANAGGTYVQYDLRGDQSHNPTGLLRVHLKGGHPLLGPSDGAVGPADRNQGAQYQPLYPSPDPAGMRNLSIGPGWQTSGGEWQVLAALTQIPEVVVLEQTPTRAGFGLVYDLGSGSTLYQTVTVEPTGVTVKDSVAGGTVDNLRIFYPMLVFDGEDSTAITLDGGHVTLGLHGKGTRFSMLRPANATLVREGVTRNHRNGRVEAAYADVQGRVAEYRVTAWPVYDPTSLRGGSGAAAMPRVRFDGTLLRIGGDGPYRAEIHDLSGRLLWSREGTGPAQYDLRGAHGGRALHDLRGIGIVTVRGPSVRYSGKFIR